MDERIIAEVSRIIGVSEEAITFLDDETKNSMKAVFETIDVKNDEDKKMLYEALDELWLKGTIVYALDEVAEDIGVDKGVLRAISFDRQQDIVFEHMMGASAEHLREVIAHEGH